MRAFIFPGQGTQTIGMGKEIYDSNATVRDVFTEINDNIGYKIEDYIFNNQNNALHATDKSQIAIMATSIAIIKVLLKDFGFDLKKYVNYVAGHSVGEYSALLSIGAFDIGTTAKLLKLRGEAMLGASPLGFSGMIAVLGFSERSSIEKMITDCKVEGEVCNIAADNGVGQLVISGHRQSIANITKKAQEYGVKKVVKLSVSGAFHSSLMQSAAEKVAVALNEIEVKPLLVPLIPNVLAVATTDNNAIKKLLVKQVVEGVRWRESMLYLKAQGVSEVVEIGHGNTLTGLMRRTVPEIATVNLQNLQDIEKFINNIRV